ASARFRRAGAPRRQRNARPGSRDDAWPDPIGRARIPETPVSSRQALLHRKPSDFPFQQITEARAISESRRRWALEPGYRTPPSVSSVNAVFLMDVHSISTFGGAIMLARSLVVLLFTVATTPAGETKKDEAIAKAKAIVEKQVQDWKGQGFKTEAVDE